MCLPARYPWPIRDYALIATLAATGLRRSEVLALTVDDVLERAGHALGPAPLALEEEHAGRVADLQLYVRQEHAERDAAALGRLVTSAASTPSADDGPLW